MNVYIRTLREKAMHNTCRVIRILCAPRRRTYKKRVFIPLPLFMYDVYHVNIGIYYVLDSVHICVSHRNIPSSHRIYMPHYNVFWWFIKYLIQANRKNHDDDVVVDNKANILNPETDCVMVCGRYIYNHWMWVGGWYFLCVPNVYLRARVFVLWSFACADVILIWKWHYTLLYARIYTIYICKAIFLSHINGGYFCSQYDVKYCQC